MAVIEKFIAGDMSSWKKAFENMDVDKIKSQLLLFYIDVLFFSCDDIN